MSISSLFRRVKPTADRGPALADNPYLSARRTWNEHVGSVISAKQTWQVVGILSLLIALASVGGIIQIGMQSKFIPVIVEVDRLGQVITVGPVTGTGNVDQRIIHATVAEFVTNARLVTPDAALQRKAVFKVYGMLSSEDPSMAKMNEWMNGSNDASPFKRASKEMVSTEIRAVLPQTAETWQVDWVETTRDRSGTPKGKPVNYRGWISVYVAAPNAQLTEEQLRLNPLNIFVRDFNWSSLL